MNGHFETWMDAYLDGELSDQQVKKFEAHLVQCADCRQRVARQRALSTLLAVVPEVTGLKSETQFVAEVGLQMERRILSPKRNSLSAHLWWRIVPLILLLMIAFILAALDMSTLLGIIPGAAQALQTQDSTGWAWLGLPEPLNSLATLVMSILPLNWNWLTGVILLLAACIVYIGWLASWLASKPTEIRKSVSERTI